MRRLLLLSGKINSGKDYTADILVKKENWVKISFASVLKQMASEKYDIKLKDFNTQEGKKKLYKDGKSYRDLLINLASDCKQIDQDFFVKKAIEEIKALEMVNIVISDWRYPHEYDYICTNLQEEFGIFTARVSRDSSLILNDSSETSLDNFNFDFKIENTGSREFICSQLFDFLT
jgi:hypothetical protein